MPLWTTQWNLDRNSAEYGFSRSIFNKGWRREGRTERKTRWPFTSPGLCDFGLSCICWTEHQENVSNPGCIGIILFEISSWQQSQDRLSQLGIDNATYIFLLWWFCNPKTYSVAYNDFCVAGRQTSLRKDTRNKSPWKATLSLFLSSVKVHCKAKTPHSVCFHVDPARDFQSNGP